MEQTGAVINIPPPSMQKDEMTVAGEKEGVADAVKRVTNIYEEKVRVVVGMISEFGILCLAV